jgi:hypothetical protein
LDSFSDVEAYALMTSGYRMTEYYLPKVQVLPTDQQEATPWDFLAIESVLKKARSSDISYQHLLRLLRSGGSRMFRIWSQSRVLLLLTLLLAMIGIVLIGTWFIYEGGPSRIVATVKGWTILTAIALAIPLGSPVIREHVGRISIGVLSLVLWIPAQFHLLVIDRLFLWMGRLDRLR